MYKAKLHAGEVEVMILAQEQKADLVIIDDNAAKKVENHLSMPKALCVYQLRLSSFYPKHFCNFCVALIYIIAI